jgi:hypothetical protein
MKKAKLRGEGWEIVFVSHKMKNASPLHPDKKGQFVRIFFNGQPIGLVSEVQVTGEAHGFSLSFKVPLFGRAITEMKDANP